MIKILSIELSNNLLSVCLLKNGIYYYKEITDNFKLNKNLLKIINSIIVSSGINIKDLDLISIGEHPSNLINKKLISLLLDSIIICWKIPVIVIPSFLTISFEINILYSYDKIILFDYFKNQYYICESVYNKNILVYFDIYTCCEKHILNLDNYLAINNSNKNILSKAIYSNVLSNFLIKNNFIFLLKKFKIENINTKKYKKFII